MELTSEEDIEEVGAWRTDFKGKLPSIQNSSFKRVCLFLQICFCAFPCRDQVFQNSREQSLSFLARYEKICEKYFNEEWSLLSFSRLAIIRRLNVILVCNEVEAVYGSFVQKSGVTKIMSHHNWRIQGTEIKGGDRHVVISFHGLDDGSSLVLVFRAWFNLIFSVSVWNFLTEVYLLPS